MPTERDGCCYHAYNVCLYRFHVITSDTFINEHSLVCSFFLRCLTFFVCPFWGNKKNGTASQGGLDEENTCISQFIRWCNSFARLGRPSPFVFLFLHIGGCIPETFGCFLFTLWPSYSKRRFLTHRVCNSHDWIVRSSFFSKASVTQRHISWQVYSESVLFLTASISFFFSFCGNWCTSGSVLEGRNTKDTGIKRALARKSGRHLDVVGLCLRSEKYDFLFWQSKNDSAKRKVNHFDLVVRINWNNSHLLLSHFR